MIGQALGLHQFETPAGRVMRTRELRVWDLLPPENDRESVVSAIEAPTRDLVDRDRPESTPRAVSLEYYRDGSPD